MNKIQENSRKDVKMDDNFGILSVPKMDDSLLLLHTKLVKQQAEITQTLLEIPKN